MAGPNDRTDDEDEIETPGPDDAEDDGADDAGQDEKDEDGEGEEEEEGAEPAEGGEPEGEVEEEAPPPRRRSAAEIREIADRAAEVERRERALAAVEERTVAEKRAADEASERDLLSKMDESQQTQYLMAKKLVSIEQSLKQNSQVAFDAADKVEAAKYLAEPRFKKFASEVERGYQELRKQGTQVSRVAVLDYMIGKSLRERGEGEARKQRKAGSDRIAKARGKPGNSRGDVAAGNRRGNSVVNRAEQEDWSI